MANEKIAHDDCCWLDSPTDKRIEKYLLDTCLPYKDDDERHTIGDYSGPIAALVKVLVSLEWHEENGPTSVETALPRILGNLQQIAKQHPAAAEQATDIAKDLFWSLLSLKTVLVAPRAQRERKTLRPLAQLNSEKGFIIETARTIAVDIWKSDTAQGIRISEMADRVYRTLVSDGFTEMLPGTSERIREWIKPVAPDYARKGGRRRKTP